MIVSTVNPFATRYVRPGMVDWIAAEPHDLNRLHGRFENDLCRRAAIIGPHGSGKSTLLEHLGPRLGKVVYRESPRSIAESGEFCEPIRSGQTLVKRRAITQPPADTSITWLALRRGDQAAKRVRLSRRHWKSGGLLILDGFEQLGWFTQCCTSLLTRQKQMGLLVTCHRPTLLKPLIEITPDVSIVRKVIEQVYRNAGQSIPPAIMYPPAVEQLLNEERGNIREVLMRLYDMSHQALPR